MGRQGRVDTAIALLDDVFDLAEVEVDPAVVEAAIAGLAPWAKPLLEPRRYKCLYGGRGSGKSYSATDALLIEGVQRPIRVLCAREFQNSIKDSVHHLLKQRIKALGLEDFYTVLDTEIRGANDTSFIFKGLRRNVTSIKSTAGLTHVWIEEAETVTQESWDVLVPTIREPGSEIWITFNPRLESDPMYQRFVVNAEAADYVKRVNWDLNPHFTAELDDERRRMQRTDSDRYDNIWNGNCIKYSKAQIFHGKWVVDDFAPGEDWAGPYYGADWGFGPDPTAAVKVWLYDRCIYIEHESYEWDLGLDEIGRRWVSDVPGIERHVVEADCSRPETIKHVRKGRPQNIGDRGATPIPQLRGCKKWPGSVEDGIEHLRSYEKIVIHSRCKHMAEEAMLYQRKVDPYTNEVLDKIIDKHNHLWDSIRYALSPFIKPRRERNHRAHSQMNW